MNIPSIDYLLDEAAKDNQPIWQIVLREEQADSGLSIEELRERVLKTYDIMRDAANGGISSEIRSVSGLTGGDAARYYRHFKNR